MKSPLMLQQYSACSSSQKVSSSSLPSCSRVSPGSLRDPSAHGNDDFLVLEPFDVDVGGWQLPQVLVIRDERSKSPDHPLPARGALSHEDSGKHRFAKIDAVLPRLSIRLVCS